MPLIKIASTAIFLIIGKDNNNPGITITTKTIGICHESSEWNFYTLGIYHYDKIIFKSVGKRARALMYLM